jgi:hypothetical protein
MKVYIRVLHPKTGAVVFETITENMMDHVDTIAPYDEAGYIIFIDRVKEEA